MGNTPKDALVYVVGTLKLDFPTWFSSDPASKRVFLPNDRPNINDKLADFETIILVARPRLERSNIIREYLCVLDFLSQDESKAMRDATLYLDRIDSMGKRDPLPTLAPQARTIDEEDFYRVNLMHMLKLRPS